MGGAARRDLDRGGRARRHPYLLLLCRHVVKKEGAESGNGPCLTVFVTAGCTLLATV